MQTVLCHKVVKTFSKQVTTSLDQCIVAVLHHTNSGQGFNAQSQFLRFVVRWCYVARVMLPGVDAIRFCIKRGYIHRDATLKLLEGREANEASVRGVSDHL